MGLKIKIKNTTFKNPVWAASGTFGYGKEFEDFFDLSEMGAIVTKTLTLNARVGNPPPRIVETASGLVNSIGLENKGIKHFKEEYFPYLAKSGTRVIVSIAGESAEEYAKCAEELSGKYSPDAIEINLSCPNVSHGQTRHKLIAQDPDETARVIEAVRRKTKAALMAKLTPNVTDIAEIARAAEKSGADAVTLVNTYYAMAVDADTRKSLIGNITGGLSGPAIKPMALKAVWDVHKAVKIPVIGVGGITSGRDVAEFMLCGASAVQVGTTNFVDPSGCARILKEFKAYLEEKGIRSAGELIGGLKT